MAWIEVLGEGVVYHLAQLVLVLLLKGDTEAVATLGQLGTLVNLLQLLA